MNRELRVPLFDMVMSLTNAVDLVSPALVNHHNRVAYVASSLAFELGLPAEEQRDLMLAGALHDVGALSLKDRLDALAFECSWDGISNHGHLSCALLETFGPFSSIAPLTRHHHTPWEGHEDGDVPLGGHILHLADRVAVLVNERRGISEQVREIVQRIKAQSGRRFHPELVEAFTELAAQDPFWRELVSPEVGSVLESRFRSATIQLDLEGILSLAKLFGQIIDFRSRFTATHSCGVAATAEALARHVGFSGRQRGLIKAAGYLHDLGKLAVPSSILEKPGKLTEEEFTIMKNHAYHTYHVLQPVEALQVVNEWASSHHERLDGSGYPFNREGRDLSLGSRIIAVADVFAALTESRPYRTEMPGDDALQILRRMAQDRALDHNVVAMLRLHYPELDALRREAELAAAKEYQQFEQKNQAGKDTRAA